ncbi:protein adenylyltransferase SelO [Histidinibacterium aquaticum]|uniref:Protein nucleotidyltransferase YdiU n=1 Tax=Histidinibacterium aquaticum TaxID=2613962 RepID=A0A5J5GC95_9RHOB|nr:YdiU family protein [Histidinibacterium aquaticum]KAA9005590.1 YdiU family protein [Histidinibacterium aquaticum]
MTLSIPFDNSYARLPGQLFTRLDPTPVAEPRLIAWNHALASELGIDLPGVDESSLARHFSGNDVPSGAQPLAQAYAGHQFGQWNPQLGDGRAILLGEVQAPSGRFDIQLKGAGRTPYSRMGDGRAWLGPVLREYVMSEAMHAMGIPTTRALAAVSTGENVLREAPLPGAILTRVAKSHVRVGTFQFFAARADTEALQALADHVIARHYPDAKNITQLLEKVVEAQADLIASWMSVGFIHGVMNTDNMSLAAETIDYGPCAFMDAYHPKMVFSSIDQFGRYAYANQPQIAVWNIAQFASALIPLMEDTDAAVEEFTEIVNRFPDHYQQAWLARFGAKLGLPQLEDPALAEELLSLMARDGADFTNVFANLPDARDEFIDRDAFDDWAARWQALGPDEALMARSNPQVVPRLHRIEQSIEAAVSGDFAPFKRLLKIATQPFDLKEEDAAYSRPPAEEERVTRTFCGT